MQAAMLHVEARRFAHGRSIATSPEGAAGALPHDVDSQPLAAAVIDSFAAKLGLAMVWPSEPRRRIAAGRRVSLVAEVDDGSAAFVRIFCSDEPRLCQLADDLVLAPGAAGSKQLALVDDGSQRASS